MIPNTDAAWLACIAIYDPITPNIFDQILRVEDDVIGLKVVGDDIVICIAGSETKAMWKDNLEIFPVDNPVLGKMHSGFFKPAQAIYEQVKPLIWCKNIVITGHSRGAAIAGCLAALFNLDSMIVSQLFLFECPKFCYQKGADFLAARLADKMIGQVLSTINGEDAVPFVPDIIGFDYVPPFLARVDLQQPPGSFRKDIDPIEWHLGGTIYEGVKKLWPGEKSVVNNSTIA